MPPRRHVGEVALRFVLALSALLVALGRAHALGPGSGIEVRRVVVGDDDGSASEKAAERLAWEVRKRTSIETVLAPRPVRLDDPSIFLTPLLYWAGARAFAPLSAGELSGLRRFVEYGGFVIIDDLAGEQSGFGASVQRELTRAFSSARLERLSAAHTVYRSFYLLDGVDVLDGLVQAGRVAVVYTRRELGALWASEPGYEGTYGRSEHLSEREFAIRLGVNLVMYALCLDYKDDQVHAPFILRRRAGRP